MGSFAWASLTVTSGLFWGPQIAVQEAAEDARVQRRLEAEAEAQRRQLEAQERLAKIEAGVVRERAEAEAEGRIKEARENEALRLRELREVADARKEMVLSAIAAVASYLEASATSLLNDPKAMQTVLAGFGEPPSPPLSSPFPSALLFVGLSCSLLCPSPSISLPGFPAPFPSHPLPLCIPLSCLPTANSSRSVRADPELSLLCRGGGRALLCCQGGGQGRCLGAESPPPPSPPLSIPPLPFAWVPLPLGPLCLAPKGFPCFPRVPHSFSIPQPP